MTPNKGQRRTDFYNLTELKERGWTPKMVSTLIDVEPTEFWGRYKTQTQKCYLKTYIEDIETTDQFKAMLEAALAKKQTAMASADRRRAELVAEYTKIANGMEVPVIPMAQLQEEAVEHWYDHKCAIACYYGRESPEYPKPDEDTLRRWVHNYVRHELTDYDSILEEIRGKVGVGEAYQAIREILDGRIEQMLTR